MCPWALGSLRAFSNLRGEYFWKNDTGLKVQVNFMCARGWETQPNNRVLYTNYKDSVIKGEIIPIPNKTRLLTMAHVRLFHVKLVGVFGTDANPCEFLCENKGKPY